MDSRDYIIYIDGKDRTKDIVSYEQNSTASICKVKFHNSDKMYTYSAGRVKIKANNVKDSDVFIYLKKLAKLNSLTGNANKKLLFNSYNRINHVNTKSVLYSYMNGFVASKRKITTGNLIFPFGVNRSQLKAVKNAFSYQVSVIEGPPGTGKTQTILNIIANIILRGKTVQIVSNNNSAIDNVLKKLEGNNLDFIAAMLGSCENKQKFLTAQVAQYPDCLSNWFCDRDILQIKKENQARIIELQDLFDAQVKKAKVKTELAELLVEKKHFEKYIEDNAINIRNISSIYNISSKRILGLIDEYEKKETSNGLSYVLFRILCTLKYGILNWKIWSQGSGQIIASLQYKFYQLREKELVDIRNKLDALLSSKDSNLLDRMCDESMTILQDCLHKKYDYEKERVIFNQRDFYSRAQKFLSEYPVVLSTTFSSANCLSDDVMYDYVIMDEASQVDIATGALALCHARNAVIVGDSKQLPNIIDKNTKRLAEKTFIDASIKDCYNYTHSFLQSIKMILPSEQCVLLREHYRCHPRIIEFCNKKFYQDELVIMTENTLDDDVLKVILTNEGNHGKEENYNQREIDVIKEEVLKFIPPTMDVGIISPYRNQVNKMQQIIPNVEIDTVHKYQGREKSCIIISTVDNQISDFVDDPNMLNVAVSRAKNKLYIVTSGNKQIRHGNIYDLIEYIRYNNFEVRKSKINSIFDYLYGQYTNRRMEFIQKHRRISQYDSENLMYGLLTDILKDNRFVALEVICHFPLCMLIDLTDDTFLSIDEKKYASNPFTHIDFVIVNKVSKLPVLLIEVDGVSFHKSGTLQAKRDAMKDSILEKYKLPFIRFPTNAIQVRRKITGKLKNLLQANDADSV